MSWHVTGQGAKTSCVTTIQSITDAYAVIVFENSMKEANPPTGAIY